MAFCFLAKSQQTHFVYLQTDNGKPFYVRLNNKIVSSSSEGYVILPSLSDGGYNLTIGFPKKEFPEATFSVNVENNNLGYLVKHFDDKGMQLFNLETLALIDGTQKTDSARLIVANQPKDSDPFSKMLANVVKDSSILQNHSVQAETPKNLSLDSSITAKTPAAPNIDTASVQNNVIAASSVNTDTLAHSSSVSSISKILSNQDSSGLQMLYADNTSDQIDTVEVFIPAKKVLHVTDNEIVTNNNNAASRSDSDQLTSSPAATNSPTEPKGFILRKDSLASNKDSSANAVQVFVIGPEKGDKTSENQKKGEEKLDEVQYQPEQSNQQKKNREVGQSQVILLPKVVTESNVNSDCKAFASNGDFLRLRKKMAAESNSEEMIKVAKKYFRNKCFSTDQVKDLSYLFLTDEGKYNFFDAAYAHTSDSDQYQILESQLKDEYYVNRFKAMIRK